MSNRLDYMLYRLKEPSTWKAITTFLTLIGISITPEQAIAIGTAGASVVSLINMFKKDAGSPDV